MRTLGARREKRGGSAHPRAFGAESGAPVAAGTTDEGRIATALLAYPSKPSTSATPELAPMRSAPAFSIARAVS